MWRRDLEPMSPGLGGRLEGRHALWKLMRSPEGSVSGLTQLSGHSSCRKQLTRATV